MRFTDSASRWPARLAVPSVAGLEGAAALLAWHGALWAGVALHALACALPPLVLWRARDAQGVSAALMRLLLPLLPALGPVAAATGIVAQAAAPLLRYGTGRTDLREHLFPRIDSDPLEAQVSELEAVGDAATAAGVTSFSDVLRWGSAVQQERVVALMAREFRPAFAPLLREALSHPTPGLRAQAAAGLSLAEARLEARTAALREAGGGLELARHLDDGANSGLLDPGRAATARAEAVEIYRAHLALFPEDAGAHAALGRDLMQTGRMEEAIEALGAALKRGLVTPAILGWLAECLYRAGRLDALVGLMATQGDVVRSASEAGFPVASSLEFWSPARAA
ncbi:tetratricopeptide repeat protein [Muricoccus radiodurans]|uniref:tetratricopeptide repeat protein n=1 Tax=Muricoccus radiodurans TaxID=2231721 RepID=UPI003CF0EEDE